jgi:hypothetical protein
MILFNSLSYYIKIVFNIVLEFYILLILFYLIKLNTRYYILYLYKFQAERLRDKKKKKKNCN